MQNKLDDILNLIFHTGEILEEDLKQKSDLRNLTPRQLICIEFIQSMKNPSLSELASRLRITKPSMTVMADRLEKNGYLYKVASDEDRRSSHVHLTEKGAKAALLHSEIHAQVSELLTRDLTDSEKEILVVLLNKSVNTLKSNM